MTGDLLQTLLSLGLVVGLILGLGWLSRRLQKLRNREAGTLRIDGGLQLGQKERLLLVSVQGQQFLLGVSAGGISLVHRFPLTSGGASAEIIPFQQHLKSQP